MADARLVVDRALVVAELPPLLVGQKLRWRRGIGDEVAPAVPSGQGPGAGRGVGLGH